MTARPGAVAVDPEEVRTAVRERYGRIGANRSGCCGGETSSSCCGEERTGASCCSSESASTLGYSPEDLAALPTGANLGLGCGNPVALAALKPGESVLDLGSGAGVDCFLAAGRVGAEGRVIGVDMTPEMISRARGIADKAGRSNVEFRLGEIEHLPVPDSTMDVVISNCVVNLSPDKLQVFREAFRVLRPGGRLAISDVIAAQAIPQQAREDLGSWSSCSSGAMTFRETKELLAAAGFEKISVEFTEAGEVAPSLEGQRSLGVGSASLQAWKPGSSRRRG